MAVVPIEVGIWKVKEQIERITFSPIESERKLEDILEKDLSILSDDLLLIGRQIKTEYGKYIDMLAMDEEGNIHIIELKKSLTPREVVAQAIDYASWVQNLTYEQILNLFEAKNDEALEKAFAEKFDTNLPEKINDSHQITIVASGLDSETERIINYLSNNFDVPINAVFFRYFKEGESEFITRSWLLDPTIVEEKSNNTKKEGKREKWNKQDFVVNFEDGNYRNWEDAIEYGFVSAGNGRWYSKTLYQLDIGSRIFCMIPRKGYVGIGKVVEKAKPINEVLFNVGGTNRNVDEVDFRASNMLHDLGNNEKCEHVVKVEWEKFVPKDKAFWVKGLMANQNSAYKLRNQYTIDEVSEFFKLNIE